jgi:hypothetical protein
MSVFEEKLENALKVELEDSEREVERDLSIISIQGSGDIIDVKGKATKTLWFVLVKGSLFWFKDFKLKSLEGDLQLKNTSVQNTDNIFKIKLEGKCLLQLRFHVHSTEWLQALSQASELGPGTLPLPLNTKDKSSGGKAQKYFASKVAVTGIGKKVARMSVDEDFKKLIKCLKTMLTNVFDAKTANKIENNIIKTLVKAHFLTLDGKLKEDWWLELDKGLRSAFETVVRICDTVNSGRTIPESTLAEQLAGIQADLRNVGRLLHARLLPFVRPKSLSRVAYCFNAFANIVFLRAVLIDCAPSVKPDALELQYAVERYLTINW